MITIGRDSHTPGMIGAGVEPTLHLLQPCGIHTGSAFGQMQRAQEGCTDLRTDNQGD